MFRAILFILFFSLTLSSCSRNPVTGKSEMQFISESQEISLGEENYFYLQQASGGEYITHKNVQTYVEKIGQKLAAVSDRPHLPYEFAVIDNSIANAWALPGGKIAINRGLLTELKSEAELAAVLAHEIVHSAARHSAAAIERAMLMQAGIIGLDQILGHKHEGAVGAAVIGAGLIGLKYSRHAELEADEYGIKYMAAAGYNPQAAVELQKTFLRLSQERDAGPLDSFLATHPPSKQRLTANEATAAQYPEGEFHKKEYYSALRDLFNDIPAYKNFDEGYEALQNENASLALTRANEAIEEQPKEAHFYNLKGKAEVMLHRNQDALASFTKAIDLNSDYFDFYLQRGLLYRQMSKDREARIDLAKSSELLPSSEAYYYQGMIELKEGNFAIALEHFKLASKSDSSIKELAEREIARIELPKHPNKYIQVELATDNSGKLVLYIDNLSDLPLTNLTIEVYALNKKGSPIGKKRFQIAELIPAHEKLRKTTSIPAPLRAKGIVTSAAIV